METEVRAVKTFYLSAETLLTNEVESKSLLVFSATECLIGVSLEAVGCALLARPMVVRLLPAAC